jgi:decaprenylphospho-beta-D-erythro-pentofuranosid-2-ulose 2-reductase
MPTVLVLGATSDIGFAIAKKFASEKYDILLAARNASHLQDSVSDIRIRYGVDCSAHSFDANQFETHTSFYHHLPQPPDIAIYVIGFMDENEKVIRNWDLSLQTINANYTGAVSILNVIAADFERRRSGTIVGVSSVAGNRGRQSNYIYGSAKAAFTAYLSGLRNRLYHHGVHVMTVLPGFVNTKMTEHLNLPKPLTAQPEEVGKAVYNGVKKKKNVIYVKWFWKWIMKIITTIPEGMFKKRKL